MAGLFAAVRDAELRSTVALINRPALVIAGQHDTVTAAWRIDRRSRAGAKLLFLPAVTCRTWSIGQSS
ncbi:hypothetical protein [Mesorhizobium sp. B2-1-3A]|uniref:hypothetical protein n=1 Tax=Mesorhizobium sp. B2-1-3A TaxID=2589971 RepID=UPI001FEFD5F9|nr:hypothetical protein [Mesorhizobium sp. B2-1-3A]